MKLSDFRRVCVGNRKILLQMKFCVGAAAATIALRSPVTGSLPSSCARAVGHRMTTDLAARYLYRRSHSARNSRSSGDHGGSTSLKLILTQPKSALVKQYQRLCSKWSRLLVQVLSRFVLELGDAISGISRVPSQ